VPIMLVAFSKEWPCRSQPLSRSRKVVFAGSAVLGIGVTLTSLFLEQRILSIVATWTNSGRLDPFYASLAHKLLLMTLVAFAVSLAIAACAFANWRPAVLVVRTLTGPNLLQPIVTAGAVFLLVSPYVILDFPGFAQGFFFSARKQSLGGL